MSADYESFSDGEYLDYNGFGLEFNYSDSVENSNEEQLALRVASESGRIPFYVISGISVLSIVLNLGTLLVIFQPKRIRPVNYLIANMSFVCILLSITGMTYFWDKDHHTFYGPWLCGIMSLTRNLLVGVASLTVMGISYERVKSLRPHMEQFLVKRTLVVIWVTAVIIVIPSYFTNIIRTSPEDPPGCKKVAPFGLISFGIVYEITRFTVFHLLVSTFMTFELYQVRSKLRYLYLFKTIPSERMRRKVQKVRFVYFYSTIFVVSWLPFGVVMSLYQTSRRYLKDTRSFRGSSHPYPKLLLLMAIICYFYLLITPVIILWTNEDLKKIPWFWRKRESVSAGGVISGNGIGIESSEMSRGTTFAKTSDSVAILSHTLSNKCAVVEVKVIASDKDGNLEEDLVQLTTKPCHTVEVHVHEDIDQLSPSLCAGRGGNSGTMDKTVGEKDG